MSAFFKDSKTSTFLLLVFNFQVYSEFKEQKTYEITNSEKGFPFSVLPSHWSSCCRALLVVLTCPLSSRPLHMLLPGSDTLGPLCPFPSLPHTFFWFRLQHQEVFWPSFPLPSPDMAIFQALSTDAVLFSSCPLPQALHQTCAVSFALKPQCSAQSTCQLFTELVPCPLKVPMVTKMQMTVKPLVFRALSVARDRNPLIKTEKEIY